MSKKLQGFLVNALIVMGVIAVVYRVEFLRKIVFGA